MASLWEWYEPEEEVSPKRKEEEIEVDDDESLLPSNKRKKLEQLKSVKAAPLLDIMVLSDSGDNADSDLEVLDEVASPSEQTGPKVDDLAGLAVPPVLPSSAPRIPRAPNPIVSEAQRRNREALARLERAAQPLMDEESDAETEKLDGGSTSPDRSDSSGEGHQMPGIPTLQGGGAGPRAADASEDDKVTLRLVTKKREQLEMRIRTRDPLSKLFMEYREQAVRKGWAQEGSTLKFMFDDDHIKGTDTAEKLEMEDGVVIDVLVS